jgi:AraC-like DNA-binding protein
VSETVPVHVVQRLMAAGARRDLDIEGLLRRSGIPHDVAYGARARVTHRQLAQFARALWEMTDDEMWGLGPRLPRGSLYFVMLTLIHAPDLRTVLDRFVMAGRILPAWPAITARTTEDAVHVTVDVSRLEDPEHLGTDLLLGVVHRIPAWLIGRRIPLRSLEMPFPAPPYSAAYLSTFGTMPTFNSDCAAVSFDSALLHAPVVRDEQDLREYMRAAPLDFFAIRDYGSTMADQVRRILEHGLSGDWPDSDEIAARLTMSAQHLRRLLREEGTSLSDIKEEIVRDAAIASLTSTDESVDDLARRLGFSEASAFRRAFRRWTGSPPGAYRMNADVD